MSIVPCRCADGYHHQRDAPQGSSPHHARAAIRDAWPEQNKPSQTHVSLLDLSTVQEQGTVQEQETIAVDIEIKRYLVLVVRVSGLEQRLVNTTTTSNDADHSAALVADGLAGTGRQLDTGLAGIRIL